MDSGVISAPLSISNSSALIHQCNTNINSNNMNHHNLNDHHHMPYQEKRLYHQHHQLQHSGHFGNPHNPNPGLYSTNMNNSNTTISSSSSNSNINHNHNHNHNHTNHNKNIIIDGSHQIQSNKVVGSTTMINNNNININNDNNRIINNITTTTTTTSPSLTLPQHQTGRQVQQRIRRSKRKVKAQKYCVVCGDRAIACNFNATTCESCKAFFRRNAYKDNLKCVFDDQCVIDRVTRRFCSSCRLRKCFKVGMLKEWILSDEQKQLKREKIMDNKRLKSQLNCNNSGNESKSSDSSYLGSYSDDGQDYQSKTSSVNEKQTSMMMDDHLDQEFDQHMYIDSARSSICEAPTPNNVVGHHHDEFFSRLDSDKCSIRPAGTLTPVNSLCTDSSMCITDAKPISHKLSLSSTNTSYVDSLNNCEPPPNGDHYPLGSPMQTHINTNNLIDDINMKHQQQQTMMPCRLPKTEITDIRPTIGGHNAATLLPHCTSSSMNEDIKPDTAAMFRNSIVPYNYNDFESSEFLAHSSLDQSNNDVNLDTSRDFATYSYKQLMPDYDVICLRPQHDYDTTPNLPECIAIPKAFARTPEEFYNPEVALNPIVLCTDVAQLSGEWKEWETTLLDQLKESSKILFKPIGEKFKVRTVREMIAQTDFLLGRLVKCMKKLSSFTTLLADDQVQILKSRCLSVLLLRSANVFEALNESWNDADGNPENKLALDWLRQPRTDDLYKANKKFLLNFKEGLRYDKMIMILLAAIIIFDTDSARINDKNALAQRKARHIYLLMRYLHRYSGDPLGTRKYLINIMLSMQTTVDSYLDFMHRETPSREVYPLLCEFFDM